MGGRRVDDGVALLAGGAVLVGEGVDAMLGGGRGLLRGELDVCLTGSVRLAWLSSPGKGGRAENVILPLAFTVDLMLAKSDVLQFTLAAGLTHPAADIVICVPPVELRNHERRGGTRIDGPVIGAFLAFHALLGTRSRAGGPGLIAAAVVHVVLSVLAVVVMLLVAVSIMGISALVGFLVHVPVAMVAVLVVAMVVGGVAVDVDFKLLLGHDGRLRVPWNLLLLENSSVNCKPVYGLEYRSVCKAKSHHQ